MTSPPAETVARLLWYGARLRERSSSLGAPTPNFGVQHSLAVDGTMRLAGIQGKYILLEAARTEKRVEVDCVSFGLRSISFPHNIGGTENI